MAESVIFLKNISKQYNLYNNRLDRLKESLDPRKKSYHRDFYALKDINLDVKKGEILGIVGKNGSGKSTLLKIIAGVLTPTKGTVNVKGNVVALLELGSGFNPEFTGMENIYFYCAVLGFKRDAIAGMVGDIIDFSELGDFINQPLKTYSSGMKARLAFAVSVNVNPDVLILDEVLAVGDELFKRKCFARMEDFFKGGKTILFVSHTIDSINELCSRAILLDRGEEILDGPAKLVTSFYQKYLYAIKGKEYEVRNEIIELNKNASLKHSLNNGISLENKFSHGVPEEEIIKADEKKIISEKKSTALKIEKMQEPYYMPDFKTKSTIFYKNIGVDIFDYMITTMNNDKVNCIITGEEYYFKYTIKSKINVKQVSVGFQVKSEKGVKISAIALSKNSDLQIKQLKMGDEYSITFKFKCNLLSGIYYTNCGVSGIINSDRVQLNRIVDSLVFKVIPQLNNHILSGIITLEQELLINKIQ
jgi:lipopolysaccharide transport system ATP-binding protein